MTTDREIAEAQHVAGLKREYGDRPIPRYKTKGSREYEGMVDALEEQVRERREWDEDVERRARETAEDEVELIIDPRTH